MLDAHLGKEGVTAEDWRLAGDLMAVSDATRERVQAELRRTAAEANVARAKAEGVREVIKSDSLEAAAVQRASRAAMTALTKRPGDWMTGSELRRAVPSRVRPDLDTALEALKLVGSVEVEQIDHHGQPGRRYRSKP